MLLRAWTVLACLLSACGGPPPAAGPRPTEGVDDQAFEALDEPPSLTEVARSSRQWTGVAVTAAGRVFVSYPRWSDDVPVSVAWLEGLSEAGPVDAQPVPFPDEAWNGWREGDPTEDRWVAVQSVVVDAEDRLWVLDTGNPRFGGVIDGAPKLVAFDPRSGEELLRVAFASPAITERSYLNDVRVDAGADHAYLTDSGDGALVVVDLSTGEARRLLDDHPFTEAEPGLVITVEGEPWLRGGEPPRVHADGIALDPRERHLYFKALSGAELYRVSLDALDDPALSDAELAARVEHVASPGPADGLLFGPDRRVWITAIERFGLEAFVPESGEVVGVLVDARLAWPDSLAAGPDGAIWVTSSQIHRAPDPAEPYRLFRVDASALEAGR
ncbi:MAG TPA: L-dopachrome tautomerase-related protein [Sandaracinaceae bacterium LLY-WYZ-13_1]|nr:L-dopachrome tautomerase-related protein [Sandaracinaceae bacterium LLY-WYZ-13_1]